MRLFRSCTLAKLVLFIALLAPVSTGSPFPPSSLARDVAIRSMIESVAHFPGPMLNADNTNTIQHPAMRELEKRTNGLKLTYAYPLKLIIPIENAAQSLVHFYNAISVKASGAQGNAPLTKIVDFVCGNLMLSMMSNEPIPWGFVDRFVDKMIRATRLGFTGTYEIMYGDKSTNAVVCILLPVFDHKTGLEARSSATSKLERSTVEISQSNKRPRAPKDRLLSGKPQLHRRLLDPRSYTQPVAEGAGPPRISLKKRNLPKPATAFALQVFHATGLITPVELAARYLEDFYDIIALKVETGFWGSIPPMHNLVLKRWNYELTFFCYAAPIPWEFIQEVALEMSSWAERGFTAEFDALYSAVDNLGKEIFVSVVMKLVQGNGLDPIIHT